MLLLDGASIVESKITGRISHYVGMGLTALGETGQQQQQLDTAEVVVVDHLSLLLPLCIAMPQRSETIQMVCLPKLCILSSQWNLQGK